LGQESLADKIEYVAKTQGDGAGFDILSFEPDGTDRFIEVKTTKYGKYSPFFITANELKFSERNQKHYHLHRIFQFRNDPHLFSVPGSVEKNFFLYRHGMLFSRMLQPSQPARRAVGASGLRFSIMPGTKKYFGITRRSETMDNFLS